MMTPLYKTIPESVRAMDLKFRRSLADYLHGTESGSRPKALPSEVHDWVGNNQQKSSWSLANRIFWGQCQKYYSPESTMRRIRLESLFHAVRPLEPEQKRFWRAVCKAASRLDPWGNHALAVRNPSYELIHW